MSEKDPFAQPQDSEEYVDPAELTDEERREFHRRTYDETLEALLPPEDSEQDARPDNAVSRRSVRRETERQMGIAKADRANREEAGLPPRVHDLR
jgi:hypothetical protein